MQDSTRPIRALMRGLDALAAVNVRNGSTVSDVASDIKVPRTTAYRILETLCRTGYVVRDAMDDRYRLTIEVRRLSDGFDDAAWISQLARPVLRELSDATAWPVALATPAGNSMIVRENTDHHSPLAVERHTAGTRLPLLTSAVGRAHLAWCSAQQRDALIEPLARSAREEDALARNPGELLRILNEVRAQGYASAVRARRAAEEVSLAVPVLVAGDVLACISIRFSSAAVPMKTALERLLPRLQRAAAQIGKAFQDAQASAAATVPPGIDN